MGIVRIRSPVAENIALQTAGRMGGIWLAQSIVVLLEIHREAAEQV
jgi:hypothetical protein